MQQRCVLAQRQLQIKRHSKYVEHGMVQLTGGKDGELSEESCPGTIVGVSQARAAEGGPLTRCKDELSSARLSIETAVGVGAW